MYNIYIADNTVNNEDNNYFEIPEVENNQSDLNLPQIPPEVNTQTTVDVTTNDVTPINTTSGILIISGIVLVSVVLIIIAAMYFKKLKSQISYNSSDNLKKDNKIQAQIIDSEAEAIKSYATPDNIKNCIRLFLENTRIN